ncbi:hypothetical protein LR48_Vigan04g125100 [Vigna angularis]|uniref:Uncharacterized protein n=1 Tax=Phaseolus angularis TaxID=3914 RepID=A0A0L9UE94_PHAAN|nr:hypothetical protein LR48_Vigan04g125100 [Vigna angularis]
MAARQTNLQPHSKTQFSHVLAVAQPPSKLSFAPAVTQIAEPPSTFTSAQRFSLTIFIFKPLATIVGTSRAFSCAESSPPSCYRFGKQSRFPQSRHCSSPSSPLSHENLLHQKPEKQLAEITKSPSHHESRVRASSPRRRKQEQDFLRSPNRDVGRGGGGSPFPNSEP